MLTGERFKLSENVGKKIIILNFFFATWCGPCKDEIPELNRFYEKHKEEPFILIGINDEREDKIREFINQYSVSFPVGIDKDGKLQKVYGVKGFPTTVFIGVDGTVHVYEIGPIMNADIAFDSFYMIIPSFNPFAEKKSHVYSSLRASGADWIYILLTFVYTLMISSLFYLLCNYFLKRKRHI